MDKYKNTKYTHAEISSMIEQAEHLLLAEDRDIPKPLFDIVMDITEQKFWNDGMVDDALLEKLSDELKNFVTSGAH